MKSPEFSNKDTNYIFLKFERLLQAIQELSAFKAEDFQAVISESKKSDADENKEEEDETSSLNPADLLNQLGANQSKSSYALYKHLQVLRSRILDLDDALLTPSQGWQVTKWNTLGITIGMIVGAAITSAIAVAVGAPFMGVTAIALIKLGFIPGAFVGAYVGYKISNKIGLSKATRDKDGNAKTPLDAKNYKKSAFLRTFTATMEKAIIKPKEQELHQNVNIVKRSFARMTS